MIPSVLGGFHLWRYPQLQRTTGQGNKIIGYMSGTISSGNRQAPYDWARNSNNGIASKAKAAALLCLVGGTVFAGAQAVLLFVLGQLSAGAIIGSFVGGCLGYGGRNWPNRVIKR